MTSDPWKFNYGVTPGQQACTAQISSTNSLLMNRKEAGRLVSSVMDPELSIAADGASCRLIPNKHPNVFDMGAKTPVISSCNLPGWTPLTRKFIIKPKRCCRFVQ